MNIQNEYIEYSLIANGSLPVHVQFGANNSLTCDPGRPETGITCEVFYFTGGIMNRKMRRLGKKAIKHNYYTKKYPSAKSRRKAWALLTLNSERRIGLKK